MRLFSIRANDKAKYAEHSRTYFIAATSEDEAIRIFDDTAYAGQHERLIISAGGEQPDLPGPKFWGFTRGGRLLNAPER